MPEGKQLSFQYGEVSPSLRYRSDAAFRSSALYTAKNGFIRKEGGFSNRQGTTMIAVHPRQNDIPVGNQDPSSIFHSFKNDSGEDRLLSVTIEFISGIPIYREYIYSYDKEFVQGSDFTGSGGGLAKKCELTQVEDITVLHYGEVDNTKSLSAIVEDTVGPDEYTSGLFTLDIFDDSVNNGGAATISGALLVSGQAPLDIPATYLITSVDPDGVERVCFTQAYSAGHPHQFLAARWILSNAFFSVDNRYNIYRSAGSANGVYGLVDSIIPSTDGVQTYTFTDFIVTADITFGPPTDNRLWGEGKDFAPNEVLLSTATRLMKYQQRLFVSYQDAEIDKNTIGVSKLGSLKMLSAPHIYRDTEAFEFNLPVRYSGAPLHMLAMERGLVFTEEGVFMIAGATEQGVITPSQPNPILVSSEGCSDVVAPRNSGNTGYFINDDHSKLIRVEISVSGQPVFQEINVLSNHFFREDLIRLEIVKTIDADFVYILRRDGKVICATVSATSVGFSLMDFEAKVEDICSVTSDFRFSEFSEFQSATAIERNKKPTNSLLLTIVRDGVRYIEIMHPRQDHEAEGFMYADAAKYFGARLARQNDGTYFNVGAPATATDGHYCNSFSQVEPVSLVNTGGTTYQAGELTRVYAQADLSTTLGAATYIDFFYDDSDGYKRTIRFERAGAPNWDGSVFFIEGFFDANVPAELQNVLNAPAFSVTPDYDQNGLITRYALPINQVTGLSHLANKEVSVFADGFVVSSPNNPTDTYSTLSVDGAGSLSLPDYYSYGYVGLPYEAEMETLPIEPSDNRSLVSENKILNEATIAFDNTQGVYVSDDSSAEDVGRMDPVVFRENEDFDALPENFSGAVDVNFSGSYSRDSRVKIKQVDPLPMTVLSVYPKGVSGG